MENKNLVDIVFDQITQLGFKIKDVTHPDGYFLCDYGKDSVTHFKLKGHGISRKWKFGLWVNAEEMSEEKMKEVKEQIKNGELSYDHQPKVIQLFAQYETQIDKFKPSRSELCVEYDAEQIDNFLNKRDLNVYGQPYTFNGLKDMLRMMYKHPFMCYDGFCGNYAVGYHSHSFIISFIKGESYIIRKKIKKKLLTAFWYPYTKIKCWFAKKAKCIDSLRISCFEKENPGWSTSYLYEVQYVFTEEATSEEECDWLGKWFHKDEYGKYGYDCIVKVDSCRKIGKDERYFYPLDNNK